MKRRVMGLQSRKIYLERELEAVKNCLQVLKNQIKSFEEHEEFLARN